MVRIDDSFTSDCIDLKAGKTTSSNVDDGDLSIDILKADFLGVVQAVFPDPSTAPTLLVCTSLVIESVVLTKAQLVGHSMGGSVVVHSCAALLEKKYKIGGVAVLDVVEGTFPNILMLNSTSN